MTTNTKSNCNSTDLCQYDSSTRPRFFDRMLLTDEDLRSEQAYHRNALKRVNRYLWGAGIVCGLEVKWVSGLCIQVHPGAALDCDGNLIEVCRCISIDLSKLCKDLYPGGCIPAKTDVVKKYLVIRYAEIEAEPVPVQSGSDDCTSSGDAGKCQASRYREGYCIEFRDQCPNPQPCGDEPKKRTGLLAALVQGSRLNTDEKAKEYVAQNQPEGCAGPPCPDCQCHECAVGLAELDIECSKGEVKVTCKCRDYVCSPRLWQWLSCELLDGFADATDSSNEPMRTFGKMADARVVAGRPVSAAWDMGKTLAFSSSDGRKNFETQVLSRFLPHIARFAQGLQAQDMTEQREFSTRLKERIDDMQYTKLKELADRIDELNSKLENLPGGRGKK